MWLCHAEIALYNIELSGNNDEENITVSVRIRYIRRGKDGGGGVII